MLQAEVGSVKANPDRDAEGIVVEAYLGKGPGTVATALVKRGTNRVGDVFVAGETHGRVLTSLLTTVKSRMKEAGPSTRVCPVSFEAYLPLGAHEYVWSASRAFLPLAT